MSDLQNEAIPPSTVTYHFSSEGDCKHAEVFLVFQPDGLWKCICFECDAEGVFVERAQERAVNSQN